MSLTIKKVNKAKRAGKRARLSDAGGDNGVNGVRGLYLCVSNRKAASWYLRYQLNGAQHWMGLGSAQTFTLAEARKRAKAERQKLEDKIDPLEAKHAARANAATPKKIVTFETMAHKFIADRVGDTADQWESSLEKFVFP